MTAARPLRRRRSCWLHCQRVRGCGPWGWIIVAAIEGLALHVYSQFLQLGVADRGGRVDHEVDGFGSFRKWDDFAQAVGTGKEHDDAVEAQGNTAVRRRAVLEGVEKEAEARLSFVVSHAQRAKNLLLHLLLMNA